MFKRVRDVFRPQAEPGPATYRLSDLPGILDVREAEITRLLAEKTSDQRKSIRYLRVTLKERVEDLASKDREAAYHPKLESIAKSTLPLFERAMSSALTKDLPEDPEEFYHDATESLKGCVKGLSGQGRYLRGVFPEEMKEIRGMVDEIGREMNAMTPPIADARKNRDLIRSIRSNLSRLGSALAEKRKGEEEIAHLKDEIDRERKEMGQIRERIGTMKETAETGSLRILREEVTGCRSDLLSVERALQSDLAAIRHVLRKGEKVIGRSARSGPAKDLELLVDALSGVGIPDEEQVVSGLARALPLINSVIGSGDLILKNKEEKELFSGQIDLSARVREGYARRADAERILREKEHVLERDPLLGSLSEAVSEEERKSRRIAALQNRLTGIMERNSALQAEIPDLEGQIRGSTSTLLGHPATLVLDDDPGAAPSEGETGGRI